jgi:hypothetical protein
VPGPQGETGAAGPAGPAGQDAVSFEPATYIGSEACAECHEGLYDTFIMSGHPHKLKKIVDGQPPDYPFSQLPGPPEGYSWEEISYVIGGYNWKARFMDQDGYIITGADENATTQYNLFNDLLDSGDRWVGYHAGEANLPYDCGSCHTTGYSPQGNQDGRPGIVGTWAFPGVQCEACHGPGSLHASHPQSFWMEVDRDSEACGECHFRNAAEVVDARDGFIQHHEQYEELFQSKHAALDCVLCHDPHTGVVQLREAELENTTRTRCENCHFKQAETFKLEVHPTTCTTCHMPRIVKNAEGDPARFIGDIRTHMMAIDPNQIEQFTADGTAALSQIGLNFACRQCHLEGNFAPPLTDEELIAAANGMHTPATPEPTAAPAP